MSLKILQCHCLDKLRAMGLDVVYGNTILKCPMCGEIRPNLKRNTK